jgi:hypothetical protein
MHGPPNVRFVIIHTVVLLYADMLILCDNLQILYTVCDIATKTTNDTPQVSNEVSSLY